MNTIFRFRPPLWLTAIIAVFTLMLGTGAGLIAGAAIFSGRGQCLEDAEICQEFQVFWQSWKLARERFVEPEAADPDRMIAGAVQGMLDSLGDQGHTQFLTADDAARWDESLSGAFEGIGAFMDEREGRIIVVEPIPGSPAEEAGLQPGDWIVAVDGVETSGKSIEEVAPLVRGPEGTRVTLTIERDGLRREVELERRKIEIPSVTWQMLPDQVALIQLRSFSQRASNELRQALNEAQNQGARAVLLDLRNNPGGLVQEAVGVASQFLPEGTPVLVEEERSGERRTTRTRDGGVALDIPLALLVNEYTASSSEIVAGALQDAGRAQIVGVPTIGTGTVLTPFTLQDGARLLLGTSQWLTPEGRVIRSQGISPDVEVALPDDARQLAPDEAALLSREALISGEDTQLARGFQLLDIQASR